jgi:catechol 2,3-dioxygenase-like lactoylglutathione lyase family enzyme
LLVRISLDHAHLFASDLNQTVAFFRDMLGATVVWDDIVAGARGVRLQIGRAFVHVYDQPPRAPRSGAFHHLGIETDDLDALIRKMAARGYHFRNPVRDDGGFRYVMIAGPDELLIELFECREPQRWRIAGDTAKEGSHADTP